MKHESYANSEWRYQLQPGDVVETHWGLACIADTHYGKYGLRYCCQHLDAAKKDAQVWLFPAEIDVTHGSVFRESNNQYGFPNLYDEISDPEHKMPVCPGCNSYVMPNRGSGTLCDACEHEFNVHCAHDYADVLVEESNRGND